MFRIPEAVQDGARWGCKKPDSCWHCPRCGESVSGFSREEARSMGGDPDAFHRAGMQRHWPECERRLSVRLIRWLSSRLHAAPGAK